MAIRLKNDPNMNSALHKAGYVDNGTADNASTGTYYLTNDPTHYEIQRTNTFEFQVPGLTTKLTQLGVSIPQNTYALDNADDILKISVAKSFVPHFTQSVIQVKRGNNTMKFAGAPEFTNGQLILNDYIGAGTKDVLMAWQNQSYDVRTEKVGLASDYKMDAYLIEYTPDFQVVRSWKLLGCWISSLTEDDYNYDSAEKHTITATIEYDKAWIDIDDIEQE